MSKTVQPLAERDSRMTEHGRIRFGVKTGKAMKAIDTLRFTSPDKAAIDELAKLYGGTVKPWSDDKSAVKNQYEVITQAREIDVVLPPGSLSSWYELWTGGGCVRRCDGVVCQVPGQDGWDEVACLCEEKGRLACSIKTRLTMIIPNIPFGGTWRLDTGSDNATRELAAMEEMVEAIQAKRGALLLARLGLEQRQRRRGKDVRNFVVPVLRLTATPMEIIQGGGTVQALARADNLALPQPEVRELDVPQYATPDGMLQVTGGSVVTVDSEGITDVESWTDEEIIDAVTLRFPDKHELFVRAMEDIDAGRVIFEGVDQDGKAKLRRA